MWWGYLVVQEVSWEIPILHGLESGFLVKWPQQGQWAGCDMTVQEMQDGEDLWVFIHKQNRNCSYGLQITYMENSEPPWDLIRANKGLPSLKRIMNKNWNFNLYQWKRWKWKHHKIDISKIVQKFLFKMYTVKTRTFPKYLALSNI